ncbi:MAG: hypothetical protein RIQ81_2592 [Pseudomonadota bacterium]|jgi:hypothetical protein
MKHGTYFIDPGACLVSLLATEFLPAQSRDLSSTWVVLPTRRLATWITASMLGPKSRQAMLAPRMLTLDQFVDALVEPLDLQLERQPTGSVESILFAMLGSGKYRHLDRSHAHELAHLAGVLTDNNVTSQELDRSAIQILRQEIYRSEEHVCALMERIKSVTNLFSCLETTLAAAGLVTQENYRADLSRQIAEKSATTGVEMPWQNLVLAGFTSMVPSQVPMLKALAARKDVAVILTRPPQTGGEGRSATNQSPLARLASALNGHAPEGNSPGRIAAPAAAVTEMRAIIAPDRATEVELALDIALDCATRSPNQRPDVAILLPDERAYEPRFRAAIEARIARGSFQGGKAPNLAAALPLAQTTAGAWALQWLAFLDLPGNQDGVFAREHRQTLLALLANPLTSYLASDSSSHLPADDTTRSRSQQLLGLAAAATPTLGRMEKTIRKHGKEHPPVAEVALQTWGWVANAKRAMLSSGALTTLDLLGALFARAVAAASKRPWQFSQFSADVRRDARGEDRQILEALERCIFETRNVCAILQGREKIDAHTTIQIAMREMTAATIRQTGEPLLGIQILTLAEARHIPFQTAVVVGCNEGVFPRSLPKDRLLDQYLLRRLGLPVWEDLEAMEDTTFLLLKSRVAKLVMTAAASAGDQPLVPSRYIELAATLDGVTIEHVHPEPAIPAPEPGQVPTSARYSGKILTSQAASQIILNRQSASRLESLIACPFRFALDSQRVRPAENYDDFAQLRRGNWLHECIDLAFSTDWEGPGPIIYSADLANVAASLVRRLVAASESAPPPELRDSDLLAHLRVWSWPRLAEFSARRWAQAAGFKPVSAKSEWDFDLVLEEAATVDPATGERGTLTGPFTGKIDRFEHLGGAWLVVDYKTMSVSKPGAVSSGTRPQLPVYAAVAAKLSGLPLDSCIAGYWSILEGRWTLAFAGEAAKKFAISAGLMGASQKPKAPQVSIGNTADLKAWREEIIKETGVFPPDHSDCGYCEHADICRRDDPSAGEWFSNHARSKALARKLKS